MPTTFQDRRRVPIHQPPCGPPGEQGFQADPVAVDTGLGPLRSTRANLDALGGHEAGEQGRSDVRDDGVPGEGDERSQVPTISLDGVGRAVVGDKVRKELVYRFVYSHGLFLLVYPWLLVLVHTGIVGGLYQAISDMVARLYAGE